MGEINDIGGISLSLFQVIVMITLKLWPLAELALPLLLAGWPDSADVCICTLCRV